VSFLDLYKCPEFFTVCHFLKLLHISKVFKEEEEKEEEQEDEEEEEEEE
jgi:hypothetical protein